LDTAHRDRGPHRAARPVRRRLTAVERDTIDIYEAEATTYRANRSSRFADRAAALAAVAGGPVLDAGCGPGTYLPSLGPESVGLDASASMLDLATAHDRPLVRADLGRLPFRPRALGAD